MKRQGDLQGRKNREMVCPKGGAFRPDVPPDVHPDTCCSPYDDGFQPDCLLPELSSRAAEEAPARHRRDTSGAKDGFAAHGHGGAAAAGRVQRTASSGFDTRGGTICTSRQSRAPEPASPLGPATGRFSPTGPHPGGTEPCAWRNPHNSSRF